MPNKKIGLIALLVGLAASELMAGNLTSYAPGDVLICFRNGQQNDLVVDAGQISTFTNLTPGQRITISTYTGGQLHYVSTNAVNWSAFTWFSDGTLFVTKARSSLETQTTPWQDNSGGNQQLTADRMSTIPPGTVDEAAYIPPGAGSSPNSATAVVEGDVSAGNPDYVTGESYHDAYFGSAAGNFGGTFRGSPENTTLGNFVTSGKVVRSDFYQMTPTSGFGLGKLLGYFEFSTNGAMAYVAYPSTRPIIKSFSRGAGMNTITYTTGTYGTYTLRATNSLTTGVPPTSWPAVSILNTGDTATHSANDTTTDNAKYYVITTQ